MYLTIHTFDDKTEHLQWINLEI